jgi:hypothetical protein
MTYANREADAGQWLYKKWTKNVVIEADLHLLSFTFIVIHDHMLVYKISMPNAGLCVCTW